MPRRVSLTNKRFGKLKVLSMVSRNDHGNSKWKCLCDCGKETEVWYQHLTTGRTKSCGCSKHEHAKKGEV